MIAIVYTSLVALMQEDIKKLIAYSSVAHMGFVTMGIFAANQQGVDGAMFQMISHGFISGALFLCVGVVYDRMHTREIAAYGGLANRMPIYRDRDDAVHHGQCRPAGHVGLRRRVPDHGGRVPGLDTGSAGRGAATGVILSAAYALWLYRRVVFGDLIKQSPQVDPGHEPARDCDHCAAGRADHGSSASTRHSALDLFGPATVALLENIKLGASPDEAADAARPAVNRGSHDEETAMTDTRDYAIVLPELLMAGGRHGAADVRRLLRRRSRTGVCNDHLRLAALMLMAAAGAMGSGSR